MANLVCQVTGCKTSQVEIDAELQTYLEGYCGACEKKREGRLCGCAFPCSLTFKGQMLLRIHELLGIEPPIGMKAIQVCYKHPDLLKKARETCIALRDSGEEQEKKLLVESLARQRVRSRQTEESSNSLGISLESVVDEEEGDKSNTLLATLEEKLGKITEVEDTLITEVEENQGEELHTEEVEAGEDSEVTSIVYTDEGGREQSLVGRIVYQTDNEGQSNIIIEEVAPRHLLMEGEEKIVKINLNNIGDNGGFILDEKGAGVRDHEEDLEQRLEEELEGREARLEEELDFQAASGDKDVKIKFRMSPDTGVVKSRPQTVGLAGNLVQVSGLGPSMSSVSTVTPLQSNSLATVITGLASMSGPGMSQLSGQMPQIPSSAQIHMPQMSSSAQIQMSQIPSSTQIQIPQIPSSTQIQMSQIPSSTQIQMSQIPSSTLLQLKTAEPLSRQGQVQLDPGTERLAGQVQADPAERLRRLVPIFPKSGQLTESVTEVTEDKEEDDNMLKIQYKEYEQKILAVEMSPLLSSTTLCDTLLVCRDGKVASSSLLLATLSPFLKTVLDTVPRIDAFRTVLLPEEVTISQVILLHKMLLDDSTTTSHSSEKPTFSADQRQLVRSLASLLGCLTLLDLTQERTQPDPLVEEVEGRGIKRKQQGVRRRGGKHARLGGEERQNQGIVKLEKTDLNADYLDPTGMVRLNSVDEMAIHYCLLCEGKFKKYNQAITHYDTVHNLVAALSCDQCDETFRDMYSCVKHKHETHGLFEVNFQCYICKEVLYSRFRLGTHIKECHKPYYGEFVCRACGMKFAAQHYLTNHQREVHSDKANTCHMCSKTFSGKRYLTMHIKSHHETNSVGSENLRCSNCERSFPSSRDLAYHASKVHGSPRPEGMFEDCPSCEKWCRTKGELALHVARMHSVQDVTHSPYKVP